MSNESNHSTSRDYELLIHKVIEQEMSGIIGVEDLEIIHSAKMKGLSGYEHQIDVAYRFKIWKTEILIIVECKQYQKNVGVDDLLEFRSRIEDLRAHKGVFITSSGFQSGALEFAKANRIALFVVRGTIFEYRAYMLGTVSPNERCIRQREQLRSAYQTQNTGLGSRISIKSKPKHIVRVKHDGVTVVLEPGELHLSMLHRWECPFRYKESGEVFFISENLTHLRSDKILKSIILDELLLPKIDC